MRLNRSYALGVILLAGCTYGVDGLKPLEAYVGKPVQTVFDAIGYPDRQEKIADATVYHWGVDQPEGPSCTVKVVADATGSVKTWDAYGNAYGCSRFEAPLKRSLRN